MLELLRIRDLALIADMELEFAPGMNVLTGETGAGKSFILKAINFLMGEKLGSDMVRNGKERAQVEALFALPDGDLVLKRELIAETGRSRLYINDSLSSQDALKDLRPALITHTSQHGQQRLLSPAYQGRLVDDWMNQPDLLNEKDRLVAALKDAMARHEALIRRSRELADRRELLELHLKDIEKVDPEPGEEERLEELRTVLRSAEQARQHYDRGLMILRGQDGPGLLDLMGQLERSLELLQRSDATFGPSLEEATTFRTSLQELDRRLRKPPIDKTEGDPERIEARLFELSQLKRKLHRTLPEILAMRDEIQENLSFLDACGLDIKQVCKEETALREQLAATLGQLNSARAKAGAGFCETLCEELAGLGFSEHVRVIAEAVPHELAEGCLEDRVRLLWAPNPGQAPQPLDRIASGGELSRFLLAVVSMQARNDNATLIFDEVDSGVGGLTLNKVADRLADLASHRQMLLITHWPQLASRAKRHFHVRKDVADNETFTRCQVLSASEREAELARMAGVEPEV